MKKMKLILLLCFSMFFVCLNASDLTTSQNSIEPQDENILLSSDKWEELGKTSESIEVLIDKHKSEKKLIKQANMSKQEAEKAYLVNDINATMASGAFIKINWDKKAEKRERYFYKLSKNIDISSETFAETVLNTKKLFLNLFYAPRFIADGCERAKSAGLDRFGIPEYYFEAKEYDFKRAIEILQYGHKSLKEFACSSVISGRSDATEYDAIIKPFIEKELDDSNYKKEVLARIEKVAHVAKGSPSPKWTFDDRSGIEYSLDDFKGRFLIIDMWATW